MNKVERPIWYEDYYKDVGNRINLSNNICYDRVLMNELNFSLDLSKIHEYPDPSKTYHVLSEFYSIDAKNLAIGYGAGDIVYRILNFLRNYSIGILTPTYDLAQTFAINLGMDVVSSTNIDDLKTDILYVANPNGVTGEVLSTKQMLELSKKYRYVIADEAYGDCCKEDFSLLYESLNLNNVIVVKTLSKSVAAPGLRFGYCISNTKFIKDFQNARSSTVVTNITHFFVPSLLNAIKPHVDRMLETKKYIEEKYECKPSQGNFVLFKKNPNFNCKIKETPDGYFRMALTDIDTFKKLEHDQRTN